MEENDKINKIWESMNDMEHIASIDLSKLRLKNEKKTKKTKEKVSVIKTKNLSNSEEKSTSSHTVPKTVLSINDAKALISSNVLNLGDSDGQTRKSALSSLRQKIFKDYILVDKDYSSLLQDLCKPIFKAFSDEIEKCRELAFLITIDFINHSCDLVPILAYFFPAILRRIPGSYGYDQELQIFVYDMQLHESYKRGRAVSRQDKIQNLTVEVVEHSEELRLLSCQMLRTLLVRLQSFQATSALHPYFEDVVVFTQAQLKDQYSEINISACIIVEWLATEPNFEIGMKYYAVALVRVLLPLLRHKLSKVRVQALRALHKCLIVPDRAKRKASGSEAIQDLVGFREENVLPIAAFYQPEVQINYLAELSTDSSVSVREQLASMLISLLTEIEDRFDHQTRLLPIC